MVKSRCLSLLLYFIPSSLKSVAIFLISDFWFDYNLKDFSLLCEQKHRDREKTINSFLFTFFHGSFFPSKNYGTLKQQHFWNVSNLFFFSFISPYSFHYINYIHLFLFNPTLAYLYHIIYSSTLINITSPTTLSLLYSQYASATDCSRISLKWHQPSPTIVSIVSGECKEIRCLSL